jgi:hypothetical protein
VPAASLLELSGAVNAALRAHLGLELHHAWGLKSWRPPATRAVQRCGSVCPLPAGLRRAMAPDAPPALPPAQR